MFPTHFVCPNWTAGTVLHSCRVESSSMNLMETGMTGILHCEQWFLIPSLKTFSFTSLHLAVEAWSVNNLKCGCGYMLMHKLMWTLTPNRSALGQGCMLTLTGERFRVCVQVRARVQLGSVLFLWSQTHNPSFTQRNAVSPRRGRPELDLKGEGQRDRDRVLGTGKHSTDPERLQTQADLRFLYIQQKHHLYNMSRDMKCVCELQ